MKSKFVVLLCLFTFLSMPMTYAATLELGNNVNEAFSTEFINEFSINISIPSEDKIVSNNVLFVLDASSINGSTWPNMRNAILESIDCILPYDDSSKNVNKVAFITFGISGYVILPLSNDKEVVKDKINKESSELLIGRSASNNEVGLKVTKEYLQSLKEDSKSKENTIVIYMSDGAVNMSEQLYDFWDISNSRSYGGTKIDAFQREVLQDTLLALEENSEIEHSIVFSNIKNNIVDLYSSYNDEVLSEDLAVSLADMINYIGSDNELYVEILKNGIKDCFLYMGYELGNTYSAGDFEKMFIEANFISDVALSSTFLNAFYVPMIINKYDKLDSSNRAVAEGQLLDDLATIYTVAYNNSNKLSYDYAKKIMDPNFGGAGAYESNIGNHYSSGLYFSNISIISEQIKSLTTDVSETNYSSLVMTGYTSKWVIPVDITGDNIFDENYITVVTGYTTDNPVIKIEKLSADELALLDNENISSNTSDSIYKITWEVTEKLKTWDQFKIQYTVKFDENEEGFVPGKKYNVNDSVILNYAYTDKSAESGESIITPMQVQIKSPVVTYQKEIENPDTYDGIQSHLINIIIMLLGTVCSGYYLRNEFNKKGVIK